MYLKKNGFNFSQVQAMLNHTLQESGGIFYSATHKVLLNRNELIVTENTLENNCDELLIETLYQEIKTPISLKMQFLDIHEVDYKNASLNEAIVDAEKVNFPLKLRKWHAGDTMQPLGMKNQKKVSDILIDNKIDVFTKDNIYVLCNATNEIVWLVGQRVSERFKVEENSKNVLKISAAI